MMNSVVHKRISPPDSFRWGASSRRAAVPGSASKAIRIGEKLVFLAAALILGGFILFHHQSFMPLLYPVIKDVQLQGQFAHIERLHVDRLVQNSIGEYFFNIDLYSIKKSIEALPWVKYAGVARIWPQTLRITIDEHQAAARWGETALISSAGVVFNPGNPGNRHLPILYARKGMESIAIEKYRQARELLSDVSFTGIEALGEDSPGTWSVLLGNGVFVRVGDIDWERRIRRFADVWRQQLYKRSDQIRYVDLRYPDGFAVAWKD